MRERLIKILEEADEYPAYQSYEGFADYLLNNGVVVLPCKVGDVVYCISGIHINFVEAAIVKEIIINDSGVSELLVATDSCLTFEDAIDTFYFTREEAERALGGAEE